MTGKAGREPTAAIESSIDVVQGVLHTAESAALLPDDRAVLERGIDSAHRRTYCPECPSPALCSTIGRIIAGSVETGLAGVAPTLAGQDLALVPGTSNVCALPTFQAFGNVPDRLASDTTTAVRTLNIILGKARMSGEALANRVSTSRSARGPVATVFDDLRPQTPPKKTKNSARKRY